MKTNRFLVPLVIGLTFFTGFSGLVFEVTWQKYLANLLGSEARATSIVLALFLGGLSLGYHFFGALSRNLSARKLLAFTGWIEIGIGAWILLFPELYHFVWTAFAEQASEGSLSFLRDVFVCFLLIGPPTFLMGGTLPLLTQALSQKLDVAPRVHALLYGINTLGAFFGCGLAGFLLLPSFGLPITLFFTAPLNLIVGIILIGVARGVASDGVEQNSSVKKITLKERLMKVGLEPLLISFISGFVSLTLQTVLIRWMGISVGSSEYAFSVVVSLFILLLALGAIQLRAEVKPNALARNQLQLFFGLVLIYFLAPTFGYVSHLVRASLASIPANFGVYHVILSLVLFALLWLALSRGGRTLPLLFALNTKREQKQAELGEAVGLIYGINTLGCVFGALFGGYLFFYLFNLDRMLWITLALSLFSVVLADRRALKSRMLVASAGILLVALFLTWPKAWLVNGTFRIRTPTASSYSGVFDFYRSNWRNQKLVLYSDSPDLSVGVMKIMKGETEVSTSLTVNAKVDGNTVGDFRTMALAGHLPTVLAPNIPGANGRAAVIGYGTGVSVGALTLHPNISRIDCMELSPAVKQAAPFFDHANHDASKNPKLNWILGDAYRALLQQKQSYDFIISEPSNPWVVGVERLYTQEFYQLVSKKLSAQGVYAQWFHTYEVGAEPVRIVLATLQSVFPEVRVFETQKGDLLLLGRKTPWTKQDLEQAKVRFDANKQANPTLAAEFEKIKMGRFTDFLPIEMPLNSWHPVETAIQTLEFPKLAYVSGKNFFMGQSGESELSKRFDSAVMVESSIENSLLNLYGATLSGDAQAKLFCGDAKQTWSQAPILCQRLNPQAYQSDSSFSPRETNVIRSVVSQTAATLSRAEANRALYWYDRLSSRAKPIPATRILPFLKSCFEGKPDLDCLHTASLAFISRGEIQAQTQLTANLALLEPTPMRAALEARIQLWSEAYSLQGGLRKN